MSNGKYNGWANYATWRVNLEMFDGMSPEDMTGSRSRPDRDDLADMLKDWATNQIIEQASGFALDYALSFLAAVEWREIAEHLMADRDYEDEDEADTVGA